MTIKNLLKNIVRYYLFHKTKIAFIHIPKCAGTTVSSYYYGRRLGHKTYLELKPLIPKSAEIIYILRHPVDRLISAYGYAKNNGGTDGDYHGPEINSLNQLEDYLLNTEDENRDPVFQSQKRYIEGLEGSPQVTKILMGTEQFNDFIRNQKMNRKKTNFIANKKKKDVTIDQKKLNELVYRFYHDDLNYYVSSLEALKNVDNRNSYN